MNHDIDYDLTGVTAPHDPDPRTSLADLFAAWQQARMRTLLAQHVDNEPAQVGDYIAELALGTRLGQELAAGRWGAVAALLRAGTAWHTIGQALGMSVEQAYDGLAWWVSGQVELYRSTGHGMTPAEADELQAAAEAVIA